MNKLKRLYHDFFGLTEQTTMSTTTSSKGAVKMSKTSKPDDIKKITDKGVDVKLENTDMVDEAQLINHMTDYRGGVEYVVYDPATAQTVANDIQQWAERKGFTIVTKNISKSGKVGYFYFRLGKDSARESQKIQGYISQLPSVKHFRFNVKSQKQKPQRPTQDTI